MLLGAHPAASCGGSGGGQCSGDTRSYWLCFVFSERRRMRQTITVRAAVGGELPQWYTAELILTELQAMEVSAGSNDLSAGSPPELLGLCQLPGKETVL